MDPGPLKAFILCIQSYLEKLKSVGLSLWSAPRIGWPLGFRINSVTHRAFFNFHQVVKVVPDEASLRQDSLRQDSLKQRVAYRAPGFERSCAQNGRKTH